MQQPGRDGKEYRNKKTEESRSKEAKEHIRNIHKYNFKVIGNSTKNVNVHTTSKMPCSTASGTGRDALMIEASRGVAETRESAGNKIPVLGSQGAREATMSTQKSYSQHR